MNTKLSFRAAVCLVCTVLFQSAVAESLCFGAFRQIETKYTIILYKTDEDLSKFNHCLEFGPNQWSLKQIFQDTEAVGLTESLGIKIDNIHERVQEILDMRKRFPKITIHVYSNREELDEAYLRIFRKQNKLRAWYLFENNTIYLHVDDLHEGILAHEMAHSIIDHFLTTRPPAASAEILARYVDSHIHP